VARTISSLSHPLTQGSGSGSKQSSTNQPLVASGIGPNRAPAETDHEGKLLDVALAFAVAGRWPEVISSAVEPGWIATKMGGSGAPGTVSEGVQTQLWLVTGDDPDAQRSG
jgi:hypothetical protein